LLWRFVFWCGGFRRKCWQPEALSGANVHFTATSSNTIEFTNISSYNIDIYGSGYSVATAKIYSYAAYDSDGK